MESLLYVLAGIGVLALCGLGYFGWAVFTTDWSK
jgi:hypothetical protein